jgi:predicted nucleic acid-binding protein
LIVLDTNVLSELMRPRPHPAVMDWMAAQPSSELFTTSICKAEIFYGLATLPDGQRRRALAAAADTMFTRLFADRVLAFDDRAALLYAQIVANRRRAGRPIEALDSLIAATALAAGASVATRDIGGFTGCGLVLINPWQAHHRPA